MKIPDWISVENLRAETEAYAAALEAGQQPAQVIVTFYPKSGSVELKVTTKNVPEGRMLREFVALIEEYVTRAVAPPTRI